MHAVLAHLPIEHVLLYADAANAVADSTASRLRRRLGHTSADSDGLRDVLTRRPHWVQGGISGGDSEFLLELVNGVAPATVLELGVASGASSAALLFALDSLGGERTLHSCDVRNTCYFDAERATGSAVGEMYPGHRTAWRLDTNTDARRILEQLPAGSIDLTFIDANHSHPWPLLDLLHITRLARPGSWVALHDIELPRLHPQYQVYGPTWLFEAWPFNKVHGIDDSINIGAVQLPPDLRDLVPMSLALLDRPWEHSPTAWHVALPEVFREVSKALAPRLPDPVRAA
jgi:predicted O-methyltransferase YrrM